MFRQTNETLYLTGLEAPEACALLDGGAQTAAAYLPHRPERAEEAETCLYAEDADRIIALAGLDAVDPWSALEGRMSSRDVLVHVALRRRAERGHPRLR